MTPVDRLIKARRQQRDAAAEELAKAQKRLTQLAAEQSQLTQEYRENIQRSVGTDALTLANLENMDTLRKWADVAQNRSQEAMEQAREIAMEYHRMLRQVEILRDRVAERKEQEIRRRERRELDEIASRMPKKLLLIPFLLILHQGSACKQEEGKSESSESEAEVVQVDRGVSSSDLKIAKRDYKATAIDGGVGGVVGKVDAMPREVDAMVFTMKELLALKKLKEQQVELEKKENELVQKEKRLSTIKPSTPASRPVVMEPKTKAPSEAPNPLLTTDLATVIKDMNSRAASAMLAEMDPGTAAAALRHLPPAQVGRLLAQMPAERAALIAPRLNAAPASSSTKADAGGARRPSASQAKSSSGDGGVQSEKERS